MSDNGECTVKHASQIQNFFAGASIFLTGGTGFVGMLLLEKLLCTNIKKVYILVRKKKDKCVEDRKNEILGNQLFDQIRQAQPQFADKVVLLAGDCIMPDLGLSESDKDIIINEVNCIFHSAAALSFNEKLRTATYSNVRATRDLIHLAKKIKDLKSFIHISTALANYNHYLIEEKFYAPTITGEKLITVVDILDEEYLEKIKPSLVSSRHNTYLFTKAVAEQVIQSSSMELPIAIFRPSIILSTAKEPVAGWCNNNIFGTIGQILWICTGLIRTVLLKKGQIIDFVPADYVVNCIISAAWEIGTSKHGRQKTVVTNNSAELPDHGQPDEDNCTAGNKTQLDKVCNQSIFDKSKQIMPDIPIFNYVSYVEKPITWGAAITYGKRHYRNITKRSTIPWNYCLITCSNYFIYTICKFLLHTAPAYAADYAGKCIGKKFNLIHTYRGVNKLIDAVSFFTVREWKFDNSNTQALWRKLNEEDRKIYAFDLSNFEWDTYFYTFVKETPKYSSKKPIDSPPPRGINITVLKIICYAIIPLLFFAICTLLTVL